MLNNVLLSYLYHSNLSNTNIFQRISQTHAAYMPTHYVLLFPHGTYGWHWGMRLSFSSSTTVTNKEVTSTRQRDHLS